MYNFWQFGWFGWVAKIPELLGSEFAEMLKKKVHILGHWPHSLNKLRYLDVLLGTLSQTFFFSFLINIIIIHLHFNLVILVCYLTLNEKDGTAYFVPGKLDWQVLPTIPWIIFKCYKVLMHTSSQSLAYSGRNGIFDLKRTCIDLVHVFIYILFCRACAGHLSGDGKPCIQRWI